MSLTHAEATAARAANSRWLELLARAGFIGYGVVHLLFAWLALQIAFGRSSGASGDQSGALRTLADEPLGRFLCAAIAVGLLAMAVWQALEAALGHRPEQGRERVAERLASVGRTLVYLYFAWIAWKVFSGAGSSADQQEALTGRLMTSSGGRWLVGLAGLVLAAIGVGLVVYGARKKFLRHLRTGEMTPRTSALARRLGTAGYVAKGVAYGIAGLLIVVAALTYDPEKARGLDAALRLLQQQSYGPLLLTLVALGIAAFGVYCFLQSRYRRV
ncbi:DUF1206 domain-containing protein [Micromonospora sp. NPDC048830]|uniref:DUF1206 domain-containing protein n=1 Tax=Micromonospora sp. NPDC048830 TaxID=3364257 RepID=UPI003712CEEA